MGDCKRGRRTKRNVTNKRRIISKILPNYKYSDMTKKVKMFVAVLADVKRYVLFFVVLNWLNLEFIVNATNKDYVVEQLCILTPDHSRHFISIVIKRIQVVMF